MKTTILAISLFFCLYVFAQQPPGAKARMTIPGVKGVLEIDVGPADFETRVRPDGKEVQLQALKRADHLIISAFLQKVDFPASPEKCRDEWWPGTQRALAVKRGNLQESTKDGIARVESMIPGFQGVEVHQKDLHGYLGSGDLCAEVHLSKPGFKPEDQQLFEQVLETVKLLPDEMAASSTTSSGAATTAAAPAPSQDTTYYFSQGSQFYLQRSYMVAAEYYQRALDLEKQNRTLSKDMFRVLVDNLGISYGISGKLPQARQTFEYGLTQDAEYPLFYYNLACTYGEMGNMNRSLEQLRLAYKYKANMIAGETFPDPLRDDSFRNFVDNDKFVKAVSEMQKQ